MDSYRVDAQDVAEGRPEALPADAAKEAQSALWCWPPGVTIRENSPRLLQPHLVCFRACVREPDRQEHQVPVHVPIAPHDEEEAHVGHEQAGCARQEAVAPTS